MHFWAVFSEVIAAASGCEEGWAKEGPVGLDVDQKPGLRWFEVCPEEKLLGCRRMGDVVIVTGGWWSCRPSGGAAQAILGVRSPKKAISLFSQMTQGANKQMPGQKRLESSMIKAGAVVDEVSRGEKVGVPCFGKAATVGGKHSRGCGW